MGLRGFILLPTVGYILKILDESWMSQIDDKICQKDGIIICRGDR